MAPVLVRSQTSDGSILGAWHAATEELLLSQVREPDGVSTYDVVETETVLTSLVRDYYVQAGQLVPKAVLTLSATAQPDAAHAPYCWEVQVTPFQPCTLLVDGIPYVLTEDDPTLELTSDAPHTFLITLQLMAQAMAEPLIVEAQ